MDVRAGPSDDGLIALRDRTRCRLLVSSLADKPRSKWRDLGMHADDAARYRERRERGTRLPVDSVGAFRPLFLGLVVLPTFIAIGAVALIATGVVWEQVVGGAILGGILVASVFVVRYFLLPVDTEYLRER
jgi:hypothetical protein